MAARAARYDTAAGDTAEGRFASALANFINQTFTNLSYTARPGVFKSAAGIRSNRAPQARRVTDLRPGKPLVYEYNNAAVDTSL